MRFPDMNRNFFFPMRKDERMMTRGFPKEGQLRGRRASIARTAFAISSNKYVYSAARLARSTRTPSRHNHGGE